MRSLISILLTYLYSLLNSSVILKEEVEELKTIVAIKDQEIELLRSRLAASTPRKGNGEFEEDKKYDADDQGTGQPPSNNEISLNSSGAALNEVIGLDGVKVVKIAAGAEHSALRNVWFGILNATYHRFIEHDIGSDVS
ncbi:hypothetical protein POTOM_050784 [Populus tomentosa]|uniref:Uncharacterized protein n=1 Tax=Populus tomentosa TaxID=118781 RepID=A0A8X7YCT3_POPTO|nr:hypothetical protein POTOM_050784 [Populus tomentosa]